MIINVREIPVVAITVVLIIIMGYILYLISIVFPFPGVKILLMSPLLSGMFTLGILMVKLKKPIFLLPVILGLLMSFISFFMGLAIIITGIINEIIGQIVFAGYNNKISIILTTAFFPVLSVLNIMLFFEYVIEISNTFIFSYAGLFIKIITYILGIIGSYYAFIIQERIKKTGC